MDHDDVIGVFEEVEQIWRSRYSAGADFPIQVLGAEDAGSLLEQTLFVAGIMANMMRQGRVVFDLTEAGYEIECRPNLRTFLDHTFALSQVEKIGVYAVHSYGRQQENNYRRVLEASDAGFPIGPALRAVIDRFLEVAGGFEQTPEGTRVQVQATPSYTGRNGSRLNRVVYQMWLLETPFTKTSMRLADQYIRAVPRDEGIAVAFHLDGAPELVPDARFIVSTLAPHALALFATIVRDDDLAQSAAALMDRVPPLPAE